VCEAVNLCGDADTIGAITGGLAGVYYKFFNIPERWKDKILVKNKLIEIAERLELRGE
jgi:ADP-ribosyl-[dinitrogen reductase] hydrolase